MPSSPSSQIPEESQPMPEEIAEREALLKQIAMLEAKKAQLEAEQTYLVRENMKFEKLGIFLRGGGKG